MVAEKVRYLFDLIKKGWDIFWKSCLSIRSTADFEVLSNIRSQFAVVQKKRVEYVCISPISVIPIQVQNLPLNLFLSQFTKNLSYTRIPWQKCTSLNSFLFEPKVKMHFERTKILCSTNFWDHNKLQLSTERDMIVSNFYCKIELNYRQRLNFPSATVSFTDCSDFFSLGDFFSQFLKWKFRLFPHSQSTASVIFMDSYLIHSSIFFHT